MTSQTQSQNTKGAATSSPWNDSPFSFSPNTNTLDPKSMPSEDAQAAREKTAKIMAALNAGDTQKAEALMGKNQGGSRLFHGMGLFKRKSSTGEQVNKVEK